MTPQPTPAARRLVKGALRGALVTALFLALVIPLVAPADAASGPTRQDAPQPAWDHNLPLNCGEQGKTEFNPAYGLPIVRWDDGVVHKALTIVVFTDATRQELDGHAVRYHYTTTAGPLSYRINDHDVTVMAGPCQLPPGITGPGPTRVPPTATPVPWQFSLTVPCGSDPSLNYNPSYGFGITWTNSLQDTLIFDAWQDSGHVAAAGRDQRTTVTTDHGFAGCKLYWTDNGAAAHTVSFFARLPNT